ncbi:MAG TPA: hypothetical protein VIK89_07610 [Cytophagaceae bacterium]
MSLLIRIVFLFFVYILPVASIMAQPNNPGDPDVPIDGGASLLAAAGVGYGAKKIRDYMKAKKQKESEAGNPELD